MKQLVTVLLLSGLVLAGGVGCASAKDTVLDGDRAVIHQTEEAGKRILANTQEEATKKVAEDIQKNMAQLKENFGPPKDPATLKPYSPEQSEQDRERSKKEHKEREKSNSLWYIGGSVLVAAAGWVLRSTSLGAIPVIGPLLAAISPRLANGAVVNERIARGAMVVIDQVRDKLDKKEPLTGADVVGMVRNVMGDAGVLAQNTRLYDATTTGVS